MARVVKADGEWIAIDFDLIDAITEKAKATLLHSAAKSRALAIETTRQHGRMYIRLAQPHPVRLVITEVVDGGAQ